MICTHNKKWAEKMALSRLHGMSREAWRRYGTKGKWHYDVLDMGFKYNMTDMNAAIGLVQLKKLAWMNDERRRLAFRYIEAFKDLPIACLEVPEDCRSSWHLFVIKVANRDGLLKQLDDEGIGYAVHFIPIYHHRYYQNKFKWDKKAYPVAEEIYQKSLSLPIWPGLSEEDQDRIINCVKHHVQTTVSSSH